MTASRTFAPPDADDAPPPMAPLLPYACLAYAEHCTRDYASYVDRLVKADAPLAAEEALGLDMIGDINKAFFALVWGPIGAIMTSARF